MRRRILGQISSGFGMTAASMPAKQYSEVSVQATASGTTLCKTLLDCNGMEGSSSISSLGHWTMEA